MRNSGDKHVIYSLEISKKQRMVLEIIQNFKDGKYSGNSGELNYDKLKLSEKEKNELHNLLEKFAEELKIYVNSSRSNKPEKT
jgi:DNA replicative helicase MCM subunit Mcm2 (Cdc46/Mcm family)